MRVAFFHGLESSPKSVKSTYLKKHYDAWCPAMDYNNPRLFDEVLEHIKSNKPDLLIGSSMGGWFAFCISTLTGIPTLLLNPAVHSRSIEPKVRIGTMKARQKVVLGKKDVVIDPEKTKVWFNQNYKYPVEFHMESNAHRTPNPIMVKHLLMGESLTENLNEEWGTESPGVGADYSFLPEEISNTLRPNFLSKIPPAGNLTLEDSNEIGLVKKEMIDATDDDRRFAISANDSPPDIFYQWLTIRGEKPSMKELKGMWTNQSNIDLINQMKYTWQRLRPYMTYDIIPLSGTTSNTYSFPSGHSCGAHYMSSKLSLKYPHLSNSLRELADKIGNSRIISGAHYPSDVEAGKSIGIMLAKLETV